MKQFLKTPQGLAIIFDAINSAWNNALFVASRDEWISNNAANYPSVRILDCHTHFIDTLNNSTHRAERYQHANGCWWFYPEVYEFRYDGNDLHISEYNRLLRHGRDAYINFMIDTVRHYRSHFRFFSTPAPFDDPTGLTGGVKDTASVTAITDVCNIINNQVERIICVPYGIINHAGNLVPPRQGENSALLWKFYPPDNRTDPKQSWLSKVLPGALRGIDQGDHTVCIHLWDENYLPTTLSNLGNLCAEFKHIRFVIFHACYPHEAELAPLLLRFPNLYAEIGGVFANQMLGMSGEDSIIADTGRPAGPNGARIMLEILRGEMSEGVGENDGKILWGTDAIWHGSPIWQIEAFKRLILTADASKDWDFKEKVLGLNAQEAFPVATSLFRVSN